MLTKGRPRIEDPRDYRVQVRFNENQRARLEAYCEKMHLKKAQVLMMGFEELERQYLKQEKVDTEDEFRVSSSEDTDTLRGQEFNEDKYSNIFIELSKLDPSETLQLALNAETDEIRGFYETISNYFMQRRQAKVIAGNMY